jgi:O-antigen ligase/polysaccharide polymerase Wzy-like membrane protein
VARQSERRAIDIARGEKQQAVEPAPPRRRQAPEPPSGREAAKQSAHEGPIGLATVRDRLLTAAIALAVVGLAYDGGTYALTSRNPVAIGIWWTLIMTVGFGLLPLARPPRPALWTGGLLAAFALWTGLSLIWAESQEKAFAEFNRVLLYLGVFIVVVAVGTTANARRWRDGMALGLVGVAVLALASRLFGDLVGDQDLLALLPGVEGRLSYPVDYWNGLAILIGLAFPLLLGCAVDRPPLGGALAVAPVPALVAVIYLTSSRGGAATAIVGAVVFCALTSRRPGALAATACAAAGAVAVIAVLEARPELVDGPLASAAAASQGKSAAVLIALVCAAVGLLYGFGSRLAPPISFRPGRSLRLALAVAGVVAVVAAVVAVDPPERFDRFRKAPSPPTAGQPGFTESHLLSGGGSGRWQFWSAAVDEYRSRPVIGRGAGSFESWWAQNGTIEYFVRDAHSLYLETLGELGLVGLALLAAVFGTGLVTGGRRLARQPRAHGALTAAFVAAFAAFAVGAAIDWMWELTVVGVIGVTCLALICGPATAVERSEESARTRRLGRRGVVGLRAAFVAAGVAVVAAQAIPLLAQSEIRESQQAAERGDTKDALQSARAARSIQSWAASTHLQIALVEEQIGDLGAARSAIDDALERDRSDWRTWLVSARLEAKAGHPRIARERLRHARRLNSRSTLLE